MYFCVHDLKMILRLSSYLLYPYVVLVFCEVKRDGQRTWTAT